MISKEFNKDYNYMGKMIADGTSNNPTTMTLTAYILKNKKFPKSAPLNIFENVLLTQWLNEINFSQQSKGRIMIRMDNPCNEVVQACKEDLLARTMKNINACHKGPPTTSKRPRRSGAHSPANSDEFLQTPCVSLLSPPSSIKYLTRRKKDKPNHNDNLAPSGSNPFVDFTKWLSSQKASPRSPSPPLSNYGDTSSNLADYLEFIKIAPHKRKGVLNTLPHNNINSYQMFKHLGVVELKLLGFNVDVITKLHSNVYQYKCHLSRAAQASPLL
ncbi:hypothetical protein PCASD_21181 [Puccinia coronata f. sp. avenae]|uniref:Uncharacterized protein n=1 Tax=Puccinia coronata f. sp. avenae TaxID=200324 RepID=A0A2N5TT52_9BASI|nr:hypothetical protein PCASD_21181 [Puccinia coronata f. sp. avenae]